MIFLKKKKAKFVPVNIEKDSSGGRETVLLLLKVLNHTLVYSLVTTQFLLKFSSRDYATPK